MHMSIGKECNTYTDSDMHVYIHCFNSVLISLYSVPHKQVYITVHLHTDYSD